MRVRLSPCGRGGAAFLLVLLLLSVGGRESGRLLTAAAGASSSEEEAAAAAAAGPHDVDLAALMNAREGMNATPPSRGRVVRREVRIDRSQTATMTTTTTTTTTQTTQTQTQRQSGGGVGGGGVGRPTQHQQLPQCRRAELDFHAALRRAEMEMAKERAARERAERTAGRVDARRAAAEARRAAAEARREEEQKRKREARVDEARRRNEEARKEQQQKKAQGRKYHRSYGNKGQQRSGGKPDPYTVLGVERHATQAEIKRAYRKLSLKYHPDKVSGEDEAAQEKAKETFMKLVDAYEIIGDPDARAIHDDETAGAYESRPHNFNSKTGFYADNSLITPLNRTEFDRLVLCKGPFRHNKDESCVPWMVEFYATWCVHCKDMIPGWKRAASQMDGLETPLGFVRFGAVNCEADKSFCQSVGAVSYPTINLYARDGSGQEHVDKFPSRRPRTAENLVEHAEKGTRLVHESTLRPIDGDVIEKEVTDPDSVGLWLVMYERGGARLCPKCGPLKSSLRRMSANIRGLANFGVLDCGKQPKVCEEQYVGNRYPVVKMYPYKGSKGTGETVVAANDDAAAVLPTVERVIRMCIANIEMENALMKTLHEEYEDDPPPPPPPQPRYEYPQPEQQTHRVLPAGVRARKSGNFIGN